MEFRAVLEERVSKKSNKTYKCIVIRLTDSLEKVIFLEPAEIELLELKYGTRNK